jgi:hypothetical protein
MKTKWFLPLAAGAAMFASGAFAAVVPPPGDPSINNLDVGDSLLSLTLDRDTRALGTFYVLTVRGPTSAPASGQLSLTFSNADVVGGSVDIVNGFFKLQAYLDASGSLIPDGTPVLAGASLLANNSLLIRGKVRASPAGSTDSWSTFGGDLWTADLTDMDAGGPFLGFATANHGGWADQAQFSSGFPESIWMDGAGVGALLGILGALPGGPSGNVLSFAGSTGAIATIPVPPALLLFGSLVPAFLVIQRRRPA